MRYGDLIKGLYLVTTPFDSGAKALVGATEAALKGGARVVQYRDKGTDSERRTSEARALLEVTHRCGGTLIINDDIELAAAIDADGVHLGREDGNIREARAWLGPGAVIGVSCYNGLGRADWALAEGADYLAFGSAYPSPTKPQAPRAGPDLIARARERYPVPLVSIGGITADNARELTAAGADAVAVISAVYAADDPEAAAAALVNACQGVHRPPV